MKNTFLILTVVLAFSACNEKTVNNELVAEFDLKDKISGSVDITHPVESSKTIKQFNTTAEIKLWAVQNDSGQYVVKIAVYKTGAAGIDVNAEILPPVNMGTVDVPLMMVEGFVSFVKDGLFSHESRSKNFTVNGQGMIQLLDGEKDK